MTSTPEEALARAVAGDAPLELLRASGGAVFRAAGVGVVRVGPPDELPALLAARRLVALGAPLAPLLREPRLERGFAVAVLADVPDTGVRDEAAFAALGRALARLHAVAAPVVGDLGLADFDPPAWVARWLRDAAVPADLRAAIDARVADLAAVYAGTGRRTVLHTDAHAGNVRIGTDGEATLVDVAALATGPGLYDLAAVEVTERRFHGDRAPFRALATAYGADPDDPRLRALCALRETLAVGFAARSDPVVAARRLDDAIAGNDARWTAI
jgi:hypothetical protein